MVDRFYIPQIVLADISQHIDNTVSKCVRRFSSVYEKEDTVTGFLFGALQTELHEVIVTDDQVNGSWKWEIDFGTFGGGGGGSSESIIGADGIIELSLTRNRETIKKSLLFQSKVDWTGRDSRLYQQAAKMLTWLGAAVVVNYTAAEFTAYDVGTVFENNGKKPEKSQSFQSLLNNQFLICKIGDSDLEYDSVKKILMWRDINYKTVYLQFNVNRKIGINVYAPNRTRFEYADDAQLISEAELAEHPLNSQALNPDIRYVDSLAELKKVKKELSKRFHPDMHPGLPSPQVTFLSDLMKSFNQQIDEREKVLRSRPRQRAAKKRVDPEEPPRL
nr:hypothetical protein [Mucilaginibacter sp. L294]